jgi:hypothetical protein
MTWGIHRCIFLWILYMKKLCSFVVVDSFLGLKAFEVKFFCYIFFCLKIQQLWRKQLYPLFAFLNIKHISLKVCYEGKITMYFLICTSEVILPGAKSSFHEGTIHIQSYKTTFCKINLHLVDDFKNNFFAKLTFTREMTSILSRNRCLIIAPLVEPMSWLRLHCNSWNFL